jgi:hypothetical protein
MVDGSDFLASYFRLVRIEQKKREGKELNELETSMIRPGVGSSTFSSASPKKSKKQGCNSKGSGEDGGHSSNNSPTRTISIQTDWKELFSDSEDDTSDEEDDVLREFERYANRRIRPQKRKQQQQQQQATKKRTPSSSVSVSSSRTARTPSLTRSSSLSTSKRNQPPSPILSSKAPSKARKDEKKISASSKKGRKQLLKSSSFSSPSSQSKKREIQSPISRLNSFPSRGSKPKPEAMKPTSSSNRTLETSGFFFPALYNSTPVLHFDFKPSSSSSPLKGTRNAEETEEEQQEDLIISRLYR